MLDAPPVPPAPVTMRDVARHAEVSVATVSRYYNASGPVGSEARARIERVAERLNYVPNTAARSLSTRRTGTVGVLLPDLYGEFYSELLRGLDRAAREHAQHLLVAGVHSGPDELAHAARALHGRVDGLVVMCPDLDARALRARLPAHLPVTFIGGGPGAEVAVDNRGGAREATRHLLRLGHRRIAHLRGAGGNHDAEERLAGYREAMAEAGPEAEPLVLDGDFTEASGTEAVRRALRAAPFHPTALFAANDEMAAGALSALREAGLAVPEGVALVGFDDVPLARHLSPALTTVHVPTASLGARALARLLAPTPAGLPACETLPATLVVRASCGAGRT